MPNPLTTFLESGIKKIYGWLYEKYLDWQLNRVYPDGVSEEEYQKARLTLVRRLKED